MLSFIGLSGNSRVFIKIKETESPLRKKDGSWVFKSSPEEVATIGPLVLAKVLMGGFSEFNFHIDPALSEEEQAILEEYFIELKFAKNPFFKVIESSNPTDHFDDFHSASNEVGTGFNPGNFINDLGFFEGEGDLIESLEQKFFEQTKAEVLLFEKITEQFDSGAIKDFSEIKIEKDIFFRLLSKEQKFNLKRSIIRYIKNKNEIQGFFKDNSAVSEGEKIKKYFGLDPEIEFGSGVSIFINQNKVVEVRVSDPVDFLKIKTNKKTLVFEDLKRLSPSGGYAREGVVSEERAIVVTSRNFTHHYQTGEPVEFDTPVEDQKLITKHEEAHVMHKYRKTKEKTTELEQAKDEFGAQIINQKSLKRARIAVTEDGVFSERSSYGYGLEGKELKKTQKKL